MVRQRGALMVQHVQQPAWSLLHVVCNRPKVATLRSWLVGLCTAYRETSGPGGSWHEVAIEILKGRTSLGRRA